MIKIQLIVAVTALVLFGTISGNYLAGWSIDLMYGSLAVYPLYLTWKTPLFKPVLLTALIWLFGRIFQFADDKTMFTFAISAYGFLAFYHVKQDRYQCAKLASATVIYGLVFAATSPGGWLLYLMQFAWNLMYVALLHMPVISNGKEEGTGHRYNIEDARKAA